MRGTIQKSVSLVCAAVLTLLAGAFAIGCGGDEPDQFPGETAGDYPVQVVQSSFRPVQRIANTYNLVIAVRNSGDETIPALSTTLDLPGLGSTLAFAYRSRQRNLAQPQRPVWVLEEGYPKLAGTVGRGGTETANPRTFNFGELEPGDTANMVWRVTAIRPGAYRLKWKLAAGLKPGVNAVLANGSAPTGTLPVRINKRVQLTRIDGQGNVVPLTADEQRLVEQSEASP